MKKLIALIAGLALTGSLGFVLAGCGADKSAKSAGNVPSAAAGTGATGSEGEAVSEPPATGTASTGETLGETAGGEERLMMYQVWFMQGEILAPVERVREFSPRVGTIALEDLLAGPHGDEAAEGFGTAIPEGTQLLGLSIEDRIATADLSSEFETGGGSLSMFARLGQVACTLDQFETVDGVLFELDGEPVDVFSGEGIILDHPVACDDYSDIVPAITVEQPHDGQEVESPVLVKGTANVFEANVTVEVLDSRGRQIATTFTTATCGTGCRGDYAVKVSFHVDREQRGTIVVHDDDAAGTGTPPNSVRIPVTLLP
ncbi:MAG: GerMN domain-containing protein [Actinomycetota bacterium]|nr:GerMN domain-containing protein [Actinomycetota bacterium]